jgi:hypothetical protein
VGRGTTAPAGGAVNDLLGKPVRVAVSHDAYTTWIRGSGDAQAYVPAIAMQDRFAGTMRFAMELPTQTQEASHGRKERQEKPGRKGGQPGASISNTEKLARHGASAGNHGPVRGRAQAGVGECHPLCALMCSLLPRPVTALRMGNRRRQSGAGTAAYSERFQQPRQMLFRARFNRWSSTSRTCSA